jgi:hypothetical protein
MASQLQRLALMAVVIVRSAGWAGVIGIVGAVLAAGYTQSPWIGLVFGLGAGFLAHMLMPKSSAS